MKNVLICGICALLIAVPLLLNADSFRCGRKVVKTNESANALIKKCGAPVRKYSSRAQVWLNGRQKRVSVSNWVYERRGKKDMIVSVYQGDVIGLKVD